MIVNVNYQRCEIYIGRKPGNNNFGNPFSHVAAQNLALIKVETREEAIACYEAWLLGEAFQEVKPEQRTWILANLHTIKGKVLGCYCKPKSCHGDVLERLANELR